VSATIHPFTVVRGGKRAQRKPRETPARVPIAALEPVIETLEKLYILNPARVQALYTIAYNMLHGEQQSAGGGR
jgi:hypothetical protein